VQTENEIVERMVKGLPYKSYKKVIVGKLYINRIDPISQAKEGAIISGLPDKDESCIIDVWSELEDLYFRKANKFHFNNGYLIEYKRESFEEQKSPNEKTEEEIEELLNSKFFVIQNEINKITSEATLLRIIAMGKKLEKSEKIISAIELRLAEVQKEAFPDADRNTDQS